LKGLGLAHTHGARFEKIQGWDTVKKFKNLFKFKRNLKEFK
jgi:hypothetical protein